MIVIKSHGGLGNQLFQYAFGRALSIKNNCKLYVYKSHNKFRPFVLNNFNTKYTIVNNNFISRNNIKYIKESTFRFNKKNLDYKTGYFDGYWQSYMYFDNIRAILLEDLVPNDINKYDYIKDENSVSLHVRRTDYLKFIDYHGICSMDYYRKALDYLKSKINSFNLYIFSDDIEWCKDNMSEFGPMKYIHTGSDIRDFCLMMSCKNNIIANSSFSWWASWLNKNNNKIVITPKKWFAEPRMQIQCCDLIPKNWISL